MLLFGLISTVSVKYKHENYEISMRDDNLQKKINMLKEYMKYCCGLPGKLITMIIKLRS